MNGKRFLAVAVIVLVAFHPLSSQETVPPPASTETSSTEPAPAETTPAEPAAPSNDAFERAIFFGKKFFELKDYASAYEQLAKADSIHPDTSGLLFNMAVLLAKLNRYADAQVKMDRYLQLYPSGQEVALIKKLQLELDFQRELQKKRQADKDYEELFNRGKFLFGKGDFEGALKIFQEAAQKHPQDPAVAYNQAIAFEQIGSYVKATERYRRYLELNQNPPDKATIDQKIFVLETEIEDMRTKIVCSWCGHKLPVGSIWCHRCWHGPYLTSSATWNTRVCGAGATATRTTYFSDGRVARNEDLPCVLKNGSPFLESLRYTPARQKAIQAARKAEGWVYSGDVLQGRSDKQGNEIKLEQSDYLTKFLAMNGGEVLAYTAHTAPGGLWLLDREDYVTEGQKYTKQYSFDSSGRISQEKVRYQNSGACNHLINVTADYAYQNDSPARVTFKGGYDGFSAEGSPTLRWDATLAYISDAQGRIEREDFAVTSYVKTYMNKPTGPNREDAWKLFPSMRLKKPHDISKLGDLCAMSGTKLIGNQIDLRPFYTLSPNLNMLLPFGVTRVTVTFTYPENFSLRTASGG